MGNRALGTMMSRCYWLRMRALLFCTAVIAVPLLGADRASAQLRIVTYNTSGAPKANMDIVLKSIGEEVKNGIAKPIDVLLLQEQSRSAGLPNTQAFVDLLNNTIYAGTGITYAKGSTIGAGDDTQTIVYRTQTVQLLGEATVGTTSTTGQPRQALRYKVAPVGYDKTGNGLDSAAFYIYDSHYKASQGTDSPGAVPNADRRNVEAVAIRTDSNGLNGGADGTHIIYAGDHNFYNYTQAAEPAVQTLIAAGNGQANDPVNRIGTWSNNASFADIDTQSPTTTAHYAGQVTGGLDDRFDFQWVSGEMQDGAGLSYIPGSYHTFGNNGTTFNTDIDAKNASMVLINTYPFTGVTSYTNAQILGALATVTDHMPVVADYQLPAKMSVAVGATPARMIVGGSTQVGVTVTNSAPVAFVNGADKLAYNVQGTGVVSGSASGMANPTAAGNLHNLTISAGATAGHQTGAVGATSTSQGAAGANFSQSVGVDVLDHSNGSFAGGIDQDSLTIDFGQLTQGSGTQTGSASIFNLVNTASFTAGLDLDQIVSAGDTGILSTTAATFSNLAAGLSHSLSAMFDTSIVGDFASTYTFQLSDEDVPGATTQTDLVLTLLGKVVSANLLGDYNGNGIVDAADYTVWRDTLGQNVANGTAADGSGNGIVDADDYTTWVMHFGETSPGSGTGAAAAVPEPSSLVLFLVGVCLAGLRAGKLSGHTFRRSIGCRVPSPRP